MTGETRMSLAVARIAKDYNGIIICCSQHSLEGRCPACEWVAIETFACLSWCTDVLQSLSHGVVPRLTTSPHTINWCCLTWLFSAGFRWLCRLLLRSADHWRRADCSADFWLHRHHLKEGLL